MIRLYNNRQFDPDTDWSLYHEATANSVAITVDLDDTYTVEFWFYGANTNTETIVDFTGDAGVGEIGHNGTDYTTTSGTIYVNGIEDSGYTINTWQFVQVKGITIDSNNSLVLSGFIGRLSQLRIVSGSDGYPTALRNFGLTGREPGLIGYWPGYRDTRDLTRLTDISNNANHGSITGAQWVRGYQLLGEESFSLGDVRLATANGEAMVWVDGLDLSAYAGALGDTDYFVRLTDDAGVMASAYCAGAGEGNTFSATIGGV